MNGDGIINKSVVGFCGSLYVYIVVSLIFGVNRMNDFEYIIVKFCSVVFSYVVDFVFDCSCIWFCVKCYYFRGGGFINVVDMCI